MLKIVDSNVSRYSKLTLQVNKGRIHRIMKSDWRGSLWISSRYGGYKILTTGEVASGLNSAIIEHFGESNGTDNKGYKYWFLDTDGELENVISIFGRI